MQHLLWDDEGSYEFLVVITTPEGELCFAFDKTPADIGFFGSVEAHVHAFHGSFKFDTPALDFKYYKAIK